MRYHRLLVLLVILVTCGGLTHLTASQSASATIPGATLVEQLVGGVGFGGFTTFDLTQSEELKNQGVKRSQIDSVKLTTLSMEITAPASGQDFTFLDSITFYVEAEGQAKAEIAHGGPFTAGATSVSLTVLDVELAPYAAAPSMSFTTDVTGRKPNNDTTVSATVALGVDVNVAGVVCGGK